MFSSAARLSRNVAMPLAAVAAASVVAGGETQKPAECGFFGLFGPNNTAVKKDIIDVIEKEEEKRGDGTSIGPTFVRLAWHASGTYSAADKTGGSNGSTMRMSPEKDWGANAGLAGARDALAPVAKKHNMSVADVWTLAGATAVEHMGGPTIQWKGGRTDSPKPTTVPDGPCPMPTMEVPTRLPTSARSSAAWASMIARWWLFLEPTLLAAATPTLLATGSLDQRRDHIL